MSTMARELKVATVQCEFLERDNKAKMADLDKALQEAREARSECRAARKEIQQAGEIAVGKPFLLQTKFGDPKYSPLNQMWSSPDPFLDLPKSAPDAAQLRKKGMQRRSFSGPNSARQTPAVVERTDGPVGRAPQDVWFCHEGRRGPAVAD